MSEASERRQRVTDEPFVVDPELLGRPLATVRRRALAIGIDAILWLLVAIPVILVLSWVALQIQAPTLAEYLTTGATTGEFPDAARAQATREVMLLVQRRRPEILPADVHEVLAIQDPEEFITAFDALGLNFNVDIGSGTPSGFDARRNLLQLRGDVVFGRASSAASMFSIGVLYFTLCAWLGRGRTPAKFLLGMRVHKLDGTPLTLGDAFSRAGGYAASLSTLGLGFLQALRDPNRQAIHDRIAGTVVVQERTGSWRRRLRLRGRGARRRPPD